MDGTFLLKELVRLGTEEYRNIARIESDDSDDDSNFQPPLNESSDYSDDAERASIRSPVSPDLFTDDENHIQEEEDIVPIESNDSDGGTLLSVQLHMKAVTIQMMLKEMTRRKEPV